MKTRYQKSIIRLLCILALIAGPAQIRAAASQREDAIRQLEEARKGKDPGEHLEKAKKHLEEARGKRQSEDKEAITRIDRAIEANKKDDHKLMEALIKEALEELRKDHHRRKI